jgi:hypothetical protein
MKPSPHLFQGEEFLNSAEDIIDAWHGWTGPGSTIRAHNVASEFGVMQETGKPVDSTTFEAQALYMAAVGLVARFYGVRDVGAFQRYLERHTAQEVAR